MSKTTFKRVEKKLLLDSSLLPQFIEAISEHMVPDEYNKDGKPYAICGIYFDNDNDDVIRHSTSKPKYKEKLRIRSYGVPDDNTTVFIEIKRKVYGVGVKRRARLKLSEAREYIESGKHPEGLKYIDEQVLREIDYLRETTPMYPKIYVSYLRHAYFGKDDKNFRITIDSDIITRRYDLALEAGRYGEPLLPPNTVLLEIKFEGNLPLWFSQLFDKLGVTFGSYSKSGTEFKKYKLHQILDTNPSEDIYIPEVLKHEFL